jgi:ribosomal protein S18 acetylase RimI-like enzyme
MAGQRLLDLESFLRTRRQFWPYEGRYSLESFGPHKFIAKIDTELAGLSWADVISPDEAMMHMNLKKEYAEYGIGTELLETLMTDLQDSGFKVIRYEIDIKYYAYQIYHNMGFEVERRDGEHVSFVWRATGNDQR